MSFSSPNQDNQGKFGTDVMMLFLSLRKDLQQISMLPCRAL